MLDPLFARRLQPHQDIPRTPTNAERVQAYRAIAPVQFYNTRFNFGPRRPRSGAPAPRGRHE